MGVRFPTFLSTLSHPDIAVMVGWAYSFPTFLSTLSHPHMIVMVGWVYNFPPSFLPSVTLIWLSWLVGCTISHLPFCPQSPWYDCHGWLGVQFLTFLSALSHPDIIVMVDWAYSVFPVPSYPQGSGRVLLFSYHLTTCVFSLIWPLLLPGKSKKKKKKKSKIFYDLRLSDLTPGIVLFAGLWPSIVSVLSLWPDNALFSGVLPDVAFSNVRCDIWGFVI